MLSETSKNLGILSPEVPKQVRFVKNRENRIHFGKTSNWVKFADATSDNL